MNFEFVQSQEWLNGIVFPVIISLLAIIIICLINRQKVSNLWQEWRTCCCLKQIGIEQRRNVICPDGLDGNFIIDRLVMLHDAMLVISFKPYGGNIYGAEQIEEWTQVIGKRSYKFRNPLFELEHQIAAINAIVPGVAVFGAIFFDHRARFPGGQPGIILNPDNIPEYYLQSRCPEPTRHALLAWQVLKNLPAETNLRTPLPLGLDIFSRKAQN